MFKSSLTGIVFAGIVSSTATAVDLRIEQFAPETSVVVFSLEGLGPIVERLDSSSLMKMMEQQDMFDMSQMISPGMGEVMDKMSGDGDIKEMMSKFGMGIAIYAEADAETGGVNPHLVGYLNFQDELDSVKEPIDEMFAEAMKQGGDTIDISGRECIMLPGGGGDDDDEARGGFSMGPDMSALEEMDAYLYLDEKQGIMLMSTSVSGMERAMDASDGESVENPLSDNEDWQGISSMIGTGGPSFVLLTSHLSDMVSSFDSSGMMGFMGGTLVAATGKINAMGAVIEVGDAPQMLTANMGLYMPEGKSGLVELMSKNSDRETLPALLETEIYGMSRYNFDFAKVIDFIKTVIRSNPFIQAQGMQALQQIEPTLAAMLDSMGGSVFMLESISRPIAKDSFISVMAMESSDTQKFNDSFAMFAGDMGMEQGDFQGHTIYTLDGGGMGRMMPGMGVQEMAVAMGGDYVMMGSRSGIQEALRNVGKRGEMELSPNLKAGLDSLPDRPLSAWSVQEAFRLMEDTLEIDELQMEQSLKELAEDDPELAEEIRADMKEERALQAGLIKELAETLGGYTFAMWSTDEGMVMQASLLEIAGSDD